MTAARTVIENAYGRTRDWSITKHGHHYRVAVYPKPDYSLDGSAPVLVTIPVVEFTLEPNVIVGRYDGHEVRWPVHP
jgi:hypothetical protein